ncbi:MAG: hypothetical protein RLZZ461_1737 [Planctomycetota bacterium]
MGGVGRSPSQPPTPQSPAATAPRKAGSGSEGGVADWFTNAVPRLAGDRSAKRIRGSVSDSVTFEFARSPSQPPPPQSPAATAPRKAGSGSEGGVADSFTDAVPRLAGDRSAQRIRGSVSDSATFECAATEPATDPPIAFGSSSPRHRRRRRNPDKSSALAPIPAPGTGAAAAYSTIIERQAVSVGG